VRDRSFHLVPDNPVAIDWEEFQGAAGIPCRASLRKMEQWNPDPMRSLPMPPPEEARSGAQASSNQPEERVDLKYEDPWPLGEGGQGRVFRVRNRQTGRLEALKVILTIPHEREQDRDRFRGEVLGEVLANARLEHGGIIRIYDVGFLKLAQFSDSFGMLSPRFEGKPYFTMEFAEKTLHTLIQQHFQESPEAETRPAGGQSPSPPEPETQPRPSPRPPSGLLIMNPSLPEAAPEPDPPPPPAASSPADEPLVTSAGPAGAAPANEPWERKAVRLLARVARAVHFMHERGVCHRDLKPSNILLDRQDKEPKLSDFGLAVLTDTGSEGCSVRGVVGTPSYMPPEQTKAGGEIACRDFYQRGDVYSLGAILYEMLTGRPPFQGETVEEILLAVQTATVLRPRDLNPRVPRDLERICLKCLERDPSRRYASAEQLARELEAFGKPRPWGRWLVTSLLAGLLLFLVTALLWEGYDRHRQYWQEIETWRGIAETNRDQAKTLSGEDHIAALGEARDAYRRLLQEPPPGPLNAMYCWLLGEPPPDRLEVELTIVELTLELGKQHQAVRNSAAARREYRDAQKAFAELKRRHPERSCCEECLADAYHGEGVAYLDEKNHAEAWKRFDKGRLIWKKLHEEDGTCCRYQRYLARSYGYLGDAELELNRIADARASYDEAERLRRTLYNNGQQSEPEDRYQFARSQGNTSYLHDWLGDLPRAIQARQDCERILRDSKGPPPELFRYDLADCLTTLAEMELDTPGLPDKRKVLARLEEALSEFDSAPAGKLQVLVARGKYYFLIGQKDRARKDLESAYKGYRELTRAGKDQPQDWYRRAQVHALLSQLPGSSEDYHYHTRCALMRLDEAVERNYAHLEKIRRDRAFDEKLRKRAEFRATLARVERRRASVK
jgi:serine/threonine protein kinase